MPDAGFRRTVLGNGLRVVSVRRADTGLAAFKVFLKVGSRHDAAHPGIAHFLEHLLLSNSGSAAARTAYATAEGLGAELNAVTTREYTALQAVAPARQSERMVHMLADLLEPAPLDADAVERERAVILEEMRLQGDSVHVIWDLFLQALWDGHPLARPVLGTAESVVAISVDDLRDHGRYYRAADRLVLAAAGDIDHDALCLLAARRWAGLRPDPSLDTVLAADAGDQASAAPPVPRACLERAAQQAHLALGAEGVAMPDPRRHALRLLEIVLGRGASSRLHQALRSERGLVYAVSSVAMSYADRGYFAVTTSCAPESAALVEALIIDELARVARDGISERELDRGKMMYEGSLVRQFEAALALAGIMGIEELLYRIEPFGESLARVHAVRAEELHRVAAALLAPERLTVAAVGRGTWPKTPATTR
jgi:predicted Zn-dependent peptidase